MWNKSALVQHVTTERRKWGDHLPEGAAGHLELGILGNKTAAQTFPVLYFERQDIKVKNASYPVLS